MHKILNLREEVETKIADHDSNLCLICSDGDKNKPRTNVNIYI